MNIKFDDRFGLAAAMQSAIDDHKDVPGIFRVGLYVPTRQEVMTLDPKTLRPILIDWMWESPSMLIPSNDQINEVRDILVSRNDSKSCAQLIADCDEYIAA